MDKEGFKLLAEAIETLAGAIKDLGERISEDEPLNYSVARAGAKVAEGLERIR